MNKDKIKEKRASFTQGEWIAGWVGTKPSGCAVVWFGETDKRIEVMSGRANLVDKTGRDEANARLIASAPAMHEVLTELLDTLELSKGYGFDEEYEQVREVLAKADGGAEG